MTHQTPNSTQAFITKHSKEQHTRPQNRPSNWIQTGWHHLQSDNEFVGDGLSPKTLESIRFFYTNINGISTFNKYESLHNTLDSMQNLQADFICLSEHNLSTDQHKVRFDIHTIIKRHLPASRTISTTSPIQFPTPFKPGGCMNIIEKKYSWKNHQTRIWRTRTVDLCTACH